MARINANDLLGEIFTDANFQAYADAQGGANGLQYREFFPLQFVPSMDFKNLEGQENPFVMADIVAWGSRAPRKGRSIPKTTEGELPKIEVARDKTERDLYIIQQLQAALSQSGSANIADQIIEEVYGDVQFTINAVNARLEGVAKALTSDGKYITTLTDNAGGVKKVEFDFGVTREDVLGDKWSESTATPITDLAKYANRGYQLMVMDNATLNNLIGNESFKGAVVGAGSADPSLEQVNAWLISKGLPAITTWNSIVTHESKGGDVQEFTAWKEGRVYLSKLPTLGRTQYTNTAEFTQNFGVEVSKAVTDGMILSTVYGEIDPIGLSSKSVAYSFPVLNNASSSVILRTEKK